MRACSSACKQNQHGNCCSLCVSFCTPGAESSHTQNTATVCLKKTRPNTLASDKQGCHFPLPEGLNSRGNSDRAGWWWGTAVSYWFPHTQGAGQLCGGTPRGSRGVTGVLCILYCTRVSPDRFPTTRWRCNPVFI